METGEKIKKSSFWLDELYSYLSSCEDGAYKFGKRVRKDVVGC